MTKPAISWEQARAMADKAIEQSAVFIKLKNHGDKVVGAFIGEPYAYEQVWNETTQAFDRFDANKHRERQASPRFTFNFYEPKSGKMRALGGNAKFFQNADKVLKKDSAQWLFEVERHGAAGNTNTSYSILPERAMTTEELAKVAALKLNDLEALAGDGGTTGLAAAGATTAPVGDGPIGRKRAAPLVARLRPLPPRALASFLERFSIRRVRQLRASDEAAAVTMLKQLEGRDADAHRPD